MNSDQSISVVKQPLPRSVLGWVTVTLNTETPPCLGKDVKQLVSVVKRITYDSHSGLGSGKSQKMMIITINKRIGDQSNLILKHRAIIILHISA